MPNKGREFYNMIENRISDLYHIKFKISEHAVIRCKERGIPLENLAVGIISSFKSNLCLVLWHLNLGKKVQISFEGGNAIIIGSGKNILVTTAAKGNNLLHVVTFDKIIYDKVKND